MNLSVSYIRFILALKPTRLDMLLNGFFVIFKKLLLDIFALGCQLSNLKN